jgi:serine/threonine protein kinase
MKFVRSSLGYQPKRQNTLLISRPEMPDPDLFDVARAIAAIKGYTLLEQVGRGSSKETFRVKLNSGAVQALKVLHPGVSLERLDREINAMVRCNHPNIGTLSSIDAIELQGATF